jgi:hypothetical protein
MYGADMKIKELLPRNCAAALLCGLSGFFKGSAYAATQHEPVERRDALAVSRPSQPPLLGDRADAGIRRAWPANGRRG